MKKNRHVTVDARSRITLGSDIAPADTTFRIVDLGDGALVLIPVRLVDAVDTPEVIRDARKAAGHA